jgi:hypothetical protein
MHSMNRHAAPRRPIAHLSQYGVTYLNRKNPWMVAWWSAAFPGFGHFLLNQYIRACLLTLWEVLINSLAHLNQAIVYTFCGDFNAAREILNPNWVYAYLLIYLFAIWDSYRSTVEGNKLCRLAELENAPLTAFTIRPLGVQYIERKSPIYGALASLAFPGLGQLYNHRFGLAFYGIFWFCFYIGMSHVHHATILLVGGQFEKSTALLHPHWLLFMPSIAGGAVYHSYETAIVHNRLFRIEQRQFLTERYKHVDWNRILP